MAVTVTVVVTVPEKGWTGDGEYAGTDRDSGRVSRYVCVCVCMYIIH